MENTEMPQSLLDSARAFFQAYWIPVMAVSLLTLIILGVLLFFLYRRRRMRTRCRPDQIVLASGAVYNPPTGRAEGVDSFANSATLQLSSGGRSYTPNLDRLSPVTIQPPASPHRYYTGSSINIGTRKTQQDAMHLAVSELSPGMPALIGVICDGMGGMENGEMASRIAVDTLVSDFKASFNPSDIPAFFERTARKADNAIRAALSSGRDSSAGTTLVAVIMAGDRLHWLSVGDSRIYILRQGEIVQVTRDHNFRLVLMEKVARGEITMAALEDNRDKEALISYLGMGGVELMDINRQPFILRSGDIVLLCSDGLTKSLSDKQIQNFVLDTADDLSACTELLARKAYECRVGVHQDNTTVIVIRYANE